MNENATASALLAMTASVTAFSALLPHLSEVRRSTLADNNAVMDVRLGEVAAAGIAVTTGFTASVLTNSSVPLVLSVATAAAMVLLYENTLKMNPGKAVPNGYHHD